MLEICPSIASGRPEWKFTRWGSAARPTRCGWCLTPPGPALNASLNDLRFRLIVNTVEVVATPAPLPKLPVARAVWRPRPDLRTSTESWLTAGGPHHTVLSTALTSDHLDDLAEMLRMELALIDDRHPEAVPARSPLEPGITGSHWDCEPLEARRLPPSRTSTRTGLPGERVTGGRA